MNKLLKKFKKDGFVIVVLGHKNKLNQLRKKFILNFDRIYNTLNQKRIKNDKNLIVEEKSKNRNLFVSVYNLLHLDPTIYQISSSRKILDIVKQLNINSATFSKRFGWTC